MTKMTNEEIKAMWATVKSEVRFEPTTGSIKPWELWVEGVKGGYPFKKRLASYKTEKAASKGLADYRAFQAKILAE